MDFRVTYLGQLVIRYKVPLDIFNAINEIYEKNFQQLKKANY